MIVIIERDSIITIERFTGISQLPVFPSFPRVRLQCKQAIIREESLKLFIVHYITICSTQM